LIDPNKSGQENRESPISIAAEADALARKLRRPHLGRIRFQLGGALGVGILLPLLFRWPITTAQLEIISSGMVFPTVMSSAIAILAGYTLIRQFIAYPGVKSTSYIAPALLTTFSLVSIVMFFLRIEYSRYLLLSSFFLSVLWLYMAFYLRDRHAKPILGVVPDGNHRRITEISGASWRPLTTPGINLQDIDGIVADLSADLPEEWERFIAKCTLAGIPVYHVRSVIESLTGRVRVEHLSENSFGTVQPLNLYLRLKRIFDISLALLLLLPVMVVIATTALTIRLETNGPIIFYQKRIGYRGRVFTCYKLRSMHCDTPADQQFTADNDPRITRVGKVIRKYRIDELPQILNILKGEMSWIGPRPEAVSLSEWYAREIPFYIYRHAVRPGISGWAQVSQGNVAEIDAAAVKLEYDFYYIKNFSPWLDFLIVMKTLQTIITGFGSK
jgi:lipopolysaccharide/colanic/teichoic acid biosynthesis glycosyltransferase